MSHLAIWADTVGKAPVKFASDRMRMRLDDAAAFDDTSFDTKTFGASPPKNSASFSRKALAKALASSFSSNPWTTS